MYKYVLMRDEQGRVKKRRFWKTYFVIIAGKHYTTHFSSVWRSRYLIYSAFCWCKRQCPNLLFIIFNLSGHRCLILLVHFQAMLVPVAYICIRRPGYTKYYFVHSVDAIKQANLLIFKVLLTNNSKVKLEIVCGRHEAMNVLETDLLHKTIEWEKWNYMKPKVEHFAISIYAPKILGTTMKKLRVKLFHRIITKEDFRNLQLTANSH